jgi:hypothetical protein
MKPLELTPEHKTKLLEMCEALFPEQSPFQIGIPGELRKGWGYSKHFIFGKSDVFADDGVFCHWFELCMTHLATSIYNKGGYYRNYVTITLFRGTIVQDADHPIDYLYNEFKKLNL